MMISDTIRSQLLEAVQRQDEISGLTHNVYKYPARCSPYFIRAAIQAFTEPGDLILDPFMGGGTTLVEGSALGRRCVGTDINSLAVFVSKAKTQLTTDRDLATVELWARTLIPNLNVRNLAVSDGHWRKLGYYKNVSTKATWRVRKLVALAVESCCVLESPAQELLARAIILNTAQWALDSRRRIPSVSEFRDAFLQTAISTIDGSKAYSDAIRSLPMWNADEKQAKPICIHRSIVGSEEDDRIRGLGSPKMVLTSPPYPGVHVLYHRWQVQGRRESPAPYWITGSADGAGASYYTFGDRHDRELKKYFKHAQAAFTSLARLCSADTLIVQMVAFAKPEWQLSAYLSMLEEAGLSEVPTGSNGLGRIWRQVPNRKWYASWRKSIPSSSEVVLFHQVRK
jgi:hypothetical protein